MSTIKFQNQGTQFLTTLKSRVDEYFKQKSAKPTGDIRLWFKAALFIGSFIGLYIWLVFYTPENPWITCLLAVLFGLDMAFIGFNVMHDGSHGSFSSKSWLNRASALTLNALGGNALLWYQKHVVNHHTYTNIEGMDEDMDAKPFFRMNAGQPKLGIHKYQHIYWVILYGFLYFLWVSLKDMRKYVNKRIAPETPKFKFSTAEHLIFWGSKIVHFFFFLALPLYLHGPWMLVPYAIALFVLGLTLSVVFQLAHIVEESTFVSPEWPTDEIVENEWAIHQLKTTSNFATRSKFLTFFLGGLNFQVEHHLFPRVSHVHYPALNKILKQTCEEQNIPYLEQPTFLSALRSHVRLLYKFGHS